MSSAPKEKFISRGIDVVDGVEVFWVDYLNEELEHPRVLRAEFDSENKANEFITRFNLA